LTSMPGLLQRFPYFLCGGKESKCRPAQGQRMKYGYEIADASERQKAKSKKPKSRMATASQTKTKTLPK
ncbi:hypothetical protein, partial [Paraburkholderia azotifigens]|uniref:hypothetical protein n=1 Tax=Paraburkholderia azotifigens TaxID=2057004 RepID=UPI00317AB597